MELKIQKIIDHLNEGRSYTEIQSVLGVSPSKISQVKTQYAHLLTQPKGNSSRGNSSSDSSAAFQNSNATKSPFQGNLGTFDTSFQDSSSDPETLLRIKKLEFEHTRLLKQMEYEDKEKERQFEREKQGLQSEKMQRQSIFQNENKELKEQLSNLEDEIEDLKYEMEGKQIEEEDIDDFDASEFWDPYHEFIEFLIENDEEKFDDDEINEVLEKIDSLRLSFQELCDSDGTEVEDFDNWEILNQAESDMNDLKKEIENSIFSSRARLSMSDEWLEKLRSEIN